MNEINIDNRRDLQAQGSLPQTPTENKIETAALPNNESSNDIRRGLQERTHLTEPITTKVQTSSFQGVERKEISLSFLPDADTLVFDAKTAKPILITNEGTQLTTELQQTLENQGYKVIVLTFPQITSSPLKNEYKLAANDDASIKNTIAQITAEQGEIGTFIHLHPHFTFTGGNFAQHFATEKVFLQTVFLLAKYLQPSLNNVSTPHRNAFLTVTRLDGKLGLGKRGNTSILGGGFSGLVKSLNLEWSSVYCRALDIQPEMQATIMAQNILTELLDANIHQTEIGISEEGRTTFATKTTILKEQETIEAQVTSNDVFLVSGGARGVTASCIIEMAAKFKNKFILVGRSSIEGATPEYAKQESNEGKLKTLIMNDLKAKGEKADLATVKRIYNKIVAKKEIEETISKIKQAGADVVYIAADVNNLSNAKAEFAAVEQKWGNITGIIHGAGRLADKFIQNKTEEDFHNVLSVKLDGLLSMLKVVNIHTLRHLILFSSVAGFYGNLGQTDYAMANEILSKAAHLFKTNHPNTKVSAINWGAWEGGMVSPELKKKFLEAGVVLVNHAGGAAMFVNELNHAYDSQPQVIIGGTLPAPESALSPELKTYRIKRNLTLANNPFLTHHSIQGNPVLPVVNAAAWMADSCVKLFPDFCLYQMKDLKLFKGIVFDGTEKTTYFTELKEVSKSAEYITFEVTITSEGSKMPTYHYKSVVTLRNKKVKLENPAFTPKAITGKNAQNGAVLYTDGSLFHGKYYQGIEEILELNDNYLIMKCKAQAVPQIAQGQFPVTSVNTFFLDIQYQGMVVWVEKQHNGAKSLPLQTALATVYHPLPFDETLFVQIEVTENANFRMGATCYVYDELGTLYLKTEGAAVTVSPQLTW